MVEIQDRVLTPDEARAVVAWSYEAPFDFYNLSGNEAVAMLRTRDEHGYGYYPVQVADEVVGFVCFGQEARVRGQAEEPGICDIGAGVRPDRVSQGLASRLLPSAVAFAAEKFHAGHLRAAVASFNERSLQLCASAGFRRVREFDGPREQRFVELLLDIDA
jgi:RimJ/RimL family protein N-acetyltransferase